MCLFTTLFACIHACMCRRHTRITSYQYQTKYNAEYFFFVFVVHAKQYRLLLLLLLILFVLILTGYMFLVKVVCMECTGRLSIYIHVTLGKLSHMIYMMINWIFNYIIYMCMYSRVPVHVHLKQALQCDVRLSNNISINVYQLYRS